MKLITIEQVDNGYIVTNKPEKEAFSACIPFSVGVGSGIHVFETFASMSKWLEGHFARDPQKIDWVEESAIPHIGTDET